MCHRGTPDQNWAKPRWETSLDFSSEKTNGNNVTQNKVRWKRDFVLSSWAHHFEFAAADVLMEPRALKQE